MVPKGESPELVKRRRDTPNTPSELELQIAAAPEEDQDNFVLDAMSRAYDPDLNMIRDMRYDDSSLPLAKNYYDFVANLMGDQVKMPFARQMWSVLNLMGEICPRCTHKNAFIFEKVPVDLDPHVLAAHLTLMEHGHCPKCGVTRRVLLHRNEMMDYTELVLVWGQRSGKSTIAASITCYALHRMCKAPRLSKFAEGIQSFTPLTASFVALTTTNAISLLWKPIREQIAASQWFGDYFSLLDRYGKAEGRELYQFNPTGLYFRLFTKGLDMYPQGPNKRTLRGFTRWLCAVDELGHFPFDPKSNPEDENEDRERANADEAHMVLTNSLLTVRGAVSSLYERDIFAYPQGLNLNISSPASWRDKIMRLFVESQDSPTIFGSKAATWEITPLFQRDHPAIQAMYRSNPKKAERDFGANPPALTSSVFDKDMVLDLFCLEPQYRIVYETEHSVHTRGKAVAVAKPARFPASIMAIDAGLTNNAFAVTVMHRSGTTIKVPVCVEIVPRTGTRIDFPYLYDNVLWPLAKALNVKEVYADRWNSAYILRQFELDSNGAIRALQYSLKGSDFKAFIEFVATKQLELTKLELDPERVEAVIDYKKELVAYPAAHLYRQFLTVQEYGGMLEKGENSTDDMFRALVLGVTRFFDAKVQERMSKFADMYRAELPTESLIVVSGRSGLLGNREAVLQRLLFGDGSPAPGRPEILPPYSG